MNRGWHFCNEKIAISNVYVCIWFPVQDCFMLKHEKSWFVFRNLVFFRLDWVSSTTQLKIRQMSCSFSLISSYSIIRPLVLFFQVLADKFSSDSACRCTVARLKKKKPPIVLLGESDGSSSKRAHKHFLKLCNTLFFF